VALIFPEVALPPTLPPADHRTPVLDNPVTVAENWTVPPSPTYGIVGETLILCAYTLTAGTNKVASKNSTRFPTLRISASPPLKRPLKPDHVESVGFLT
jgi:hypothetical protein